MAQFNADVLLNVKTSGERRLDSVKNAVAQIQRLSQQLKPINLLAPGAGKLGDAVRVQLKDIANFARDAENGVAKFSNTVSGAAGQADTFAQILSNVAVKAGGIEKQTTGVKNFAAAWAQATVQTELLERNLEEIKRDAKEIAQYGSVLAGRGPSTELGSQSAQDQQLAYDLEQLRNKEIQEREYLKRRELATEKKINQVLERNAKSEKKRNKSSGRGSAALGGALTGFGFPLLFGGGPGSILGGGIGGTVGGLLGGTQGALGGSIALGAIGQVLDQFLEKSKQLGLALEDPTKNLQALVDVLPLAGTRTKILYDQLQELGLSEVVAADAANELKNTLSETDYQALIDGSIELDNIWKDLSLLFTARVIPSLIEVYKWFGQVSDFVGQILPGGGDGSNPIRPPRATGTGADTQAGQLAAIRDEIFQREQDIARLNVQNEQQRLTARRDTLAVATAEVKIQENANKLQKAQLRLQKEENEERKAAINQEIEILKLKGQQLKAAQENARIQAERAIEDDRDAAIAREVQAVFSLRKAREEIIRLEKGSSDALRLSTNYIETNLELQQGLLQVEREKAQARITEPEVLERVLLALDKEGKLLERNADLLRRQNEARQAQIENVQKQVDLQIQLQQLQASQGFDRLNDSSPSNQFGDLVKGFGFFAETARTARVETAELARQTEVLSTQIAGIDDQLKTENISGDLRKTLTQQKSLLVSQVDLLEKYGDATIRAKTEQAAFNEAFGITSELTNEVFNGLKNVVAGTQTAEEAFASFLNTVADMLLKAAAEMIATYIAIGIARQFAGLGGGFNSATTKIGDGGGQVGGIGTLGPTYGIRQAEVGGRTMANMPYVVGEKGAELFVPGKTGTIIPADVFEATRQAVAGNGPEGGNSDAFEQNSIALGNSASITKENSLVREMGMRENEPIDVRYDSTVINDVSYVSEEQFQMGIKGAIAQSKAAMFRDLKNKPRARSGIGI